MRIIAEAGKSVRKFLQEQKIKTGIYHASQFNYILKDEEYILFNSFTRMIAVLTDEEYGILTEGAITVTEENAADPAVSECIAKRLLVPVDLDESDSYQQMADLLHLMRKSQDITDYTILTTTGCNARCFYCFEADFVPSAMKPETAEDLADYIIEHCGGQKVHLHWFGGEPLCNPNVIDLICRKLQDAEIPYSGSVTSNGSLFTDELVKKAKEFWNITYVQITLDGMGEEHNRRKNYVNQNFDPFAVTIANIHRLIENGMVVNIRLNFDGNNIESINQLINYLIKEFPACENLAVYPAMLFEDCAAWQSGRSAAEQEKLQKQLFTFRDRLQELKLFGPPKIQSDFKYVYCGSNNEKHRTVNPDGTFSVCHNVGDNVTYGDIYSGITDEEEYDRWMNNRRIAEKCKTCRWLGECTAFDQCPARRSTCREDMDDMMSRALLRAYKKSRK